MESDELELDTLGDRKTALFIITSDTDPTFDFVTAMIVSQLFNLLCTKADDEYGGRLPVHVRCLLDEVANITIPNLERLISVLRSREISACLVVQAQSQLKAIYKEHADTIIGNCDTTLFLGGKEKTTLKEISEVLGKETIDSFNTSENRGRDVSHICAKGELKKYGVRRRLLAFRPMCCKNTAYAAYKMCFSLQGKLLRGLIASTMSSSTQSAAVVRLSRAIIRSSWFIS